jgi:hypothetical protein
MTPNLEKATVGNKIVKDYPLRSANTNTRVY